MAWYLPISTMHHACSERVALHVNPRHSNFTSGTRSSTCNHGQRVEVVQVRSSVRIHYCTARTGVWKRSSMKQHESFYIALRLWVGRKHTLHLHLFALPIRALHLFSALVASTVSAGILLLGLEGFDYRLPWTQSSWNQWNQYESKLHPDK